MAVRSAALRVMLLELAISGSRRIRPRKERAAEFPSIEPIRHRSPGLITAAHISYTVHLDMAIHIRCVDAVQIAIEEMGCVGAGIFGI